MKIKDITLFSDILKDSRIPNNSKVDKDKRDLFVLQEKPINIKTDHSVNIENIFSDGYNKIKVKKSKKKSSCIKLDDSSEKTFETDILNHNYFVKPDEINKLQEIMKELEYIDSVIDKLLDLIEFYSIINLYFKSTAKLENIGEKDLDFLINYIIKNMRQKNRNLPTLEEEKEEEKEEEEEYNDHPITAEGNKLLDCLVNTYLFDVSNNKAEKSNLYDNNFIILDATIDQEKINYNSLKPEHFDCNINNRFPLLCKTVQEKDLNQLFKSKYLEDSEYTFLNKYLEIEEEDYQGELTSDYDTGFELSSSTGVISHWNFKAEDPYIVMHNQLIDEYRSLIRLYYYYSNMYDLCIELLYKNNIKYSTKDLIVQLKQLNNRKNIDKLNELNDLVS